MVEHGNFLLISSDRRLSLIAESRRRCYQVPGSPDLENGRPFDARHVCARVIGRPVDGVIELTNAALSPDGHVLIVNEESS